jgi:Carboxypeptidase regulatory-like domain
MIRDQQIMKSFAILALVMVFTTTSLGQTSGRISGTVKDMSGAVIPKSTVTATNTATGVKQSTTTDDGGIFSFPLLGIGAYTIEAEAPGFQTQSKTGIKIDVNSALTVDFALKIQEASQTVTVSEGEVQVETTDAQLGQTIESKQVTDVPLNGRSFTDLLAVQAGVSPITTSGAGNSTSGGGFGTVPVAGEQNTGQFSINGQRESDNAFYLNGVSVQEAIGQQTGVIPNLDSIAEFRILSSNVDAEYGSFTGGIINVVTKSGASQFHGSAFEFLRNTYLDARGYFSPQRSTFQQNQFGGTFGGPLKKDKAFFFADYQGQRTVQGVETGIVTVPSLANRGGNFTDSAQSLTGRVNGPYLAQTLSSRLGYAVAQNEAFYIHGCTTTSQCVFPNAVIPQRAWGNAPTHMLRYIPSPNLGANEFSSGAHKYRIQDDKGSARVDFNSNRYGVSSIYYFKDTYNLDNPFPSGLGGATVPGNGEVFDALSNGVDQTVALSNTHPFGTATVNESRFGWTRLDNNIGVPKGGVGTTLGQQGIQAGGEGIVQGYPQQAGVEMMYFNSFAVGTNPFYLAQVNDIYDLSDSVTRTLGSHTIKMGARYVWFKVKQAPNLVANGTFSFFGSGSQSTGNGYADFLLGLPDFYSQQSSPTFYESAADGDLFVQDSFRVRPNLTINYGLRWDYVTPWAEKYHQITTFVQGAQSQTFPGAPLGYLVPGDILPNGYKIPAGIAPTPLDNFSPRFGLAWSPSASGGLLKELTGSPGKTSIRLGGGRFVSSPQGLTVAYPTGNPPYGLTYTSPESPVMETPFVGALTGTQYIQQFPVQVPSYKVSVKNPDPNVNWSRYTPISGAGSVWYKNKTSYAMQYNLTVERQVGANAVFSAGYIGSLGRHLLTVHDANPGVPGICLSLSQPQDVEPGTPTCGPFGENGVYTRANGTIVNGTRSPFPNTIGTDAYYENMGNSNYNALDLTFRRTKGPLSLLASYTYGKSLDQTSSIQEQVDPYDYHRLDGPSAFDLKHNFVASYDYELPLAPLLGNSSGWINGWQLSGITRFATGIPVTFASLGDNYLVQVQNNGVNSTSIDMPNYTPGPLHLNHNPRNGREYFNTSLFTPNALGTQGNAKRRMFYGPGLDNYDMALRKMSALGEGKSIEVRFEMFNVFNHAQFYPNGSVDGNINDVNFGHVQKAADQRIGQVALKFNF